MVSLRALDDLLEDYSYVADFNPAAARRLLDDINTKMMSLAQLGITGAARNFAPNLRAFPYRDRCIYFVVTETTMTVLRVLHGRQDITAADFSSAGDTNEDN
ncbi:type II toxin-antitoxin system RelE/ParE family toxin [Neorhizobium lilium]|uniref:Type II toxin-antitoxin system RelE/ParE family toxin n=1 Tax=Neorhizobium lilium TaxID=2503024 RepID=A0A444LEA3_9HYPH|nr:type II toxin-antitoxin system RelE/ParE family toxin [Neorhizobium lilium]